MRAGGLGGDRTWARALSRKQFWSRNLREAPCIASAASKKACLRLSVWFGKVVFYCFPRVVAAAGVRIVVVVVVVVVVAVVAAAVQQQRQSRWGVGRQW